MIDCCSKLQLQSSNDTGQRRPSQLPGWFDRLAESCLANGTLTRAQLTLGETSLVPIVNLISGSAASGVLLEQEAEPPEAGEEGLATPAPSEHGEEEEEAAEGDAAAATEATVGS